MRSEKELLTKYRNIFINDQTRSVEDWKEYCYVPLDLPRFDRPDIVDWFYQNTKPTKKIHITPLNPSIKEVGFNTAEIYYNGSTGANRTSRFRTINERPDFIETFPEFYNQIIEAFPFKSFNYLMFLNSIDDIEYHRDQETVFDGPSQFRIMMHDENPLPTLGFVDVKPNEAVDMTKVFYEQRPTETNSLAWNNLRLKHGSAYNPKYRKLILGILDYELDIDRFHDLMKRSVDKYKKYAMISLGPTSDYVNT
jgi:hypothetical protein